MVDTKKRDFSKMGLNLQGRALNPSPNSTSIETSLGVASNCNPLDDAFRGTIMNPFRMQAKDVNSKSIKNSGNII